MEKFQSKIKYNYYDDLLSQLNSLGFIVVSEQSGYKLIGGQKILLLLKG